MANVFIDRVKKSYGNVVALHDITLDIPSGSFFTLLGPSGCGKTTLLRTIAGFHHQDQGSISVGEQVLDAIPVHRRDIGMVFQDYAIFPHLSVRDNIAFGLRQRKVSRADVKTRVADILRVVQLEHLADRMPHELSGGQQQRVGLARALVTRPKVLLMDEPLSNLDAQLRIDLRRELRSLQQELGITTIYVTHDQEEALEMSDHVCVMYQGVIQQAANPWTIYQEPANRFVASFVGTNNFVPIRLREGKPFLGDQPIGDIRNLPDAPDGSTIVASIRPEHVALHTGPAIAQDECESTEFVHLAATLRYQSFAGRELRLTAGLTDDIEVQFITEPRPDYLNLAPRSPITLRVRRDRIGLYADGDTGVRL
ncbi:ABC transporter ATP-binding protein [Granulosicoccus sp. 3-233]|uniref:ABC transporter ATP-binding protein n=1 Tax=Granulosicoccus sp. 3-233 TaxID=3417969 RepID=UPI003D32E12F